jgi:hypothetical protein
MIKKIDSDEEDRGEEKPNKFDSSKIVVFVATLLLVIIGISLAVHNSSALLSFRMPKLSFNSSTKQKTTPLPKIDSNELRSSLLKAGSQFGAAVLGASVKFVQETASSSAKTAASAAASMVIKSTAPKIVEEIHKLPPEQQKEVKQIICK